MRWLLLAILLVNGVPSFAANSPTAQLWMTEQPSATKWQVKKWKLQLRLYAKIQKLHKHGSDELTAKQVSKAKASMILGISSIGLLFIPYVGILAIPAAILAIIFGSQSLKGNSNTKGIVGVVTGGVTLLLFFAALIVLAAVFGGY